MQPALETERLAGRVRARQGHRCEAEQRRGEETYREDDRGALARERTEGARGIGRVDDVRLSVRPERYCARDHDERRDDVRHQCAEGHIDTGSREILSREALVGRVRLDEGLTPWGDRRADGA